jgi:thymidylate kinase
MKRKNSFLFCFSGMDGAGKTTLALKLKEQMEHNGIKTRYVMGRFESFKVFKPAYWVIKKVFLSDISTDQSNQGVNNKRGLFKNRFLAGLWQIVLLTDYIVQLAYKVRKPLILGRSVCADRYIYDTVMDLTADGALSPSKMQRLLQILLSLVPRPDMVFLIDLPEETAFARNLAKHDNLPIEYFRERRRLFLTLYNRPEVRVLDGSRKPEELFNEITVRIKALKVLS